MRKLSIILILGFLICVLAVSHAMANNVAVSNVVLQNQDVPAGTIEIKFNLTQDNTFSGTDANGATFYDRIWVFVKYWVVGVSSETTGWKHATLVSGGTVTPGADGKGAFCQVGVNQTLKWSYATDGEAGASTFKVRVMAIEMVYIPGGTFVYNAGGIGGSLYNNYNAGIQVVVSAVTQVPTGASSGWPNGYNAFYIAKYEVSQGQYTDFLNAISATDATSRFPSQTTYRHTITYTAANPYGSRYSTTTSDRACNFLSWDDATAYASWAAMRPMTEMEFEKAARGGGATNTNTYPWGNTAPTTTTYTFDGALFSQYYANYNNTSAGPVNAGHYLSGDIVRSNEQTGASPYGVTDMAGNNWEHLINCNSTATPANGNGTLTLPVSWPGAAVGKGVRGGSWYDTSSDLRVSDRNNAGWTVASRDDSVGVRPARTP